MKNIKVSDIEISFDETHHLYRGKELYNKKFKKVMSFHPPGVAAVEDDSGAYHIDLNGDAVYPKRYMKTYGFYQDIATVVDRDGYFHIDLRGDPIHNKRFSWAGNFQERRCVVRDFDGLYYHIKSNGEAAYFERYRYAGDFKYGIAAVYDEGGYAMHIDRDGNAVHEKKYLELGVYHKGFAIARDEGGYFHIDKHGKPLYSNRYEWVEPFYNDFSLVKRADGVWGIIDTNGELIHTIKGEKTKTTLKESRDRLMDYFVGYWKTQIIYAISESRILETIRDGKTTEDSIQDAVSLHPRSVRMLLQMALVWNFVEKKDGGYSVTHSGKLLLEHDGGLKYASKMWATVHYTTMGELYESLKTGRPQFSRIYGKDFFSYLQDDSKYANIYYKAMDEYAYDYIDVVDKIPINKDVKTIVDIGGGSGKLLREIIKKFPHVEKGILFDTGTALRRARDLSADFEHVDKLEFIEGDFFKDNIPNADFIILSRVLHDWDDSNAEKILRNIRRHMKEGSRLCVIEIIVPDDPYIDMGISLSFNLLVMVGGKERTKKEFENLFNRAGFEICKTINSDEIVSIMLCKLKCED